jgi:hypothetical protein
MARGVLVHFVIRADLTHPESTAGFWGGFDVSVAGDVAPGKVPLQGATEVGAGVAGPWAVALGTGGICHGGGVRRGGLAANLCWTTRTAAADDVKGAGGRSPDYDTVFLYSFSGMHTGGKVPLERP